MPALQTDRFVQREFRFPADLVRLSEARGFAEDVARQFGFDQPVCQQIKLAVNEAVANAIEHGSSGSRDEVVVRAVEEGGALAIHVVDGGSFVPRMLHRGAMPERGRGLAFMDLLMDEVELRASRSGTSVRLVKRLDG